MTDAAHAKGRYRLGFDIGGTFTDFVLTDEATGDLHVHKVLTSPADPAQAVLEGVNELLGRLGVAPADLELAIHGTTLITNALIERKGATTALVTTDGFRDVLEMGSEMRYDIYDLFMERPAPLVPRTRRYDLRERLDRRGSVLTPLDEAQIGEIAADIARQGTEAVAVCLLHSFRNPDHERRAGEALARALPGVTICLSSEVAPEIREYERMSTTAANAYVQPLAKRYLTNLVEALANLGYRRPMFLMLSSGGVTSPETAMAVPIRLAESGPAAGVLAGVFYGQQADLPSLITFDMGGTTAKAALITDGRPARANTFEVARVQRFKRGSGLPIRIPVIELIEIGAGGGSIARVDELGLLKVGPDSAGADPGPACYALPNPSGQPVEPTVTDADLLLGYLNPDYFLGGRMRLDRAAAEKAVGERIAQPLGLSVTEAAAGVFRIVNENMVAALKVHIAERGHDPRRYALLAFGGAGPVHAHELARALKVRRLISPLAAGATSALGFLATPVAFEFARSFVSRLDALDTAALRDLYGEMEREARSIIERAGVAAADVTLERSADMRHKGQGHEVTVALPDGAAEPAAMADAFYARYHDIYGHAHRHLPVELMTLRLRAAGPPPEVRLPRAAANADWRTTAVKGTRPAYFPQAGGFVDCTVYDRYALAAGATFPGPAIVEERESTLVIPPDSTATIDDASNLIVDLGGEP